MNINIFGRSQTRLLLALAHPSEVLATVYGIHRFRRPFQILSSYLTRTCPASLRIETRRGQRIFLTGDADDVVIVLTVLGRGIYGGVPKGGIVIDVGAHLGTFSLYAMSQGAGKVFAYEPDPVLNDALQRNLSANGLQNVVQATRAAVIGSGPSEVIFYPEANAAGHLRPRDGDQTGIAVPATTLVQIVHNNRLERIDLLKLDCEGSEYGIIFDSPDEIWTRIRRICIEYHHGQTDRIERRLAGLGFRRTRMRRHSDEVGLLFFESGSKATETNRNK